MTRAGISTVAGNRLGQGLLLLILAIPSIYIFLSLQPLWRDEDAFNEIASTFAPRGIVHYLPGYCLGGRLIVFLGSIAGSLISGHGIPCLSLDLTPLNDAGIYTLIAVQHFFLVFSLYYAVRTLSVHFAVRVFLAVCFALTPWAYIYANCLGSEAFSNPLVYLVAAFGWSCLQSEELKPRKIFIYFGLLLAAALTRHIDIVMAACLPIALLPLAGKELILRGGPANPINGRVRYRYTSGLLISVVAGLSVIGASALVQRGLCWMFRVPFQSTFGETFSYRLAYLETMPDEERAAVLQQISAKAGDPVVTEALAALSQSLSEGQPWNNIYLYYKIDEILVRSGFNEVQARTSEIHSKLNRIAATVLLSGESNFRKAVWTDFVLSPFFVQADLAYPPFELTDWVQSQLSYPRYERLRGLASFQHQGGYYQAAWKRIPYVHLFERVPMLEMACLAIALASVLGVLVFLGVCRDPHTTTGLCYAMAMIVGALLISFLTCLSTYFQGRLYLPVYALYQMGMLLSISMAVKAMGRACRRFGVSAHRSLQSK
jgi:hypothetical protein